MNFALIGAAGYVAPRHLRAIQETGNTLLAAYDKNDSVGVLDQYFPGADFFTEFERFDRHLDKLRRAGTGLDYLSVCSPNYLHDSHIRFGLRMGANVICEKPLVLNPWNLDALKEMERETEKKVFTILQLRLHPALLALREKILTGAAGKIHDVKLTYIAPRGNWYFASWKGDAAKSGGIATNIGIHLFDLLVWLFGAVKENIVHIRRHDRAAGYLELEKARVRWFLSVNGETIPPALRTEERRSFRSVEIDGEEVEFSDGFAELHTRSYQAILEGSGFGIEEAEASIRVAQEIRNMEPIGLRGSWHDLAELPVAEHPFERGRA